MSNLRDGGLLQRNTKTQAWRAAVARRFVESLEERSAIGLDHALRRNVVGVGRQFDEGQASSPYLGQQQPERRRGVSIASLPRDNRVADVAETIGWERGRPGLPAKADRAAELAVPHPLVKPWKSRDRRTIRQCHGRTVGLEIDLFGDESRGIARDLIELLASCVRTKVVGRPTALEGAHIAGEVWRGRPNELHWLFGFNRVHID